MPFFDDLIIKYLLRSLKALLIDLLFLNPNLFKENVNNGMRPTGVLVHSCLIYLSLSHALFDKLQELILWFNMNLSQTFHENPCFRVFSYLKASWFAWTDARERGNFASDCRAGIPGAVLARVWCRSCVASWGTLATFTHTLIQQISDLLHVYF